MENLFTGTKTSLCATPLMGGGFALCPDHEKC